MGVRALGQRFRMLLGIVTGMDPTSRCEAEGKQVIRRTFAAQGVATKGGFGVVGNVAAGPVVDNRVFVLDNDFSTGRAQVIVGPYVLTAGLDFLVGVDVNATAANLGAALAHLPGIIVGGVAGDTVHLHSTLPEPVALAVRHSGTMVNFSLTPDDGFLAPAHVVSAPVLS